MFYLDAIEKKLRFGDVLNGFVSTTPKISEPFVQSAKEHYNIDVFLPEFSAVMDPCCQIGGGTISLTPLIQVKPHFWDIKYLGEDMTRTNRKAMPKDLMHPETWNKMPVEKKLEAINARPDYGHRNYFVYEENGAFPKYTVRRDVRFTEVIDPNTQLPKYEKAEEQKTITTGHYMIDFKNIYHVSCAKISPPEKETDPKVLGSKILQLAIRTRNELRDKMALYYGYLPIEDRIDA
jgi:hypothetical protein